MIHVCYAIHDQSGKYSKLVGTSMQSLLDNTRDEVTVHIIHDNSLTATNRRNLIKIAYSHDQEIVLYNVDEVAPARLQLIRDFINSSPISIYINNRFSVGSFYRIMIPELFDKNIPRAIYLDADTIINMDIKVQWEFDLEGFPICALSSPDETEVSKSTANICPILRDHVIAPQDYFGSGGLIMDLEKIRSSGGGGQDLLLDRCLNELAKYPGSIMMDQDALNLVFHKKNKPMPTQFNHAIAKEYDSFEDIKREVYHYACEVLSMDCRIPLSRLWFSYFIKTPFCNPDAFANIFTEVERFSTQKNIRWQKFARLSEIRKRAFWNDDNRYEDLTNFFGMTDGDILINTSKPTALENLFGMMHRERGKFVFIIDTNREKYYYLRAQFNRLGFKEDEDFFYAQDFIQDHSSISGRNLVKEM